MSPPVVLVACSREQVGNCNREAWNKCSPGSVPYGYVLDIGPCMKKVKDARMARCGGE
jgi:hypothetical protein